MAEGLLETLRRAYADGDPERIRPLLAADVRWGSDGCRGPDEVIATFRRLLGGGVRGDVTDSFAGPRGVGIGLSVHLPKGMERPDDTRLFHTFLVSGGGITEIRRFDDLRSARASVGLDS